MPSRNGYLVITMVLVISSVAIFSEYYESTGAMGLQQLPDLQITDYTVSQSEITATVYNDGRSTSSAFSIGFYSRQDGADEWELVGSKLLTAGLKSTRSEEVTQEIQFKTGGDHEVKIVADFREKVKESDENNEVIKVIESDVNPDLYINGVAIDNGKIIANIYNAGGNIETEFDVAFYKLVDGDFELIGTRTVESMDAVSEAVVVLPSDSGESETLKLVVDYGWSVPESDEDNNILEKKIPVVLIE